MSIWYHGTNKKFAEVILKKGFKKGAYFAKHLESSLVMGGKYIFWVWFKEDPTKYWEYISDRNISKKNILLLRRYSTGRLYQNKELVKKIRHSNHIEQYGKDSKFCKTCDGKGEFNNREWDECANGKYGKVCSVCIGFGCVRKNGKKMNDP